MSPTYNVLCITYLSFFLRLFPEVSELSLSGLRDSTGIPTGIPQTEAPYADRHMRIGILNPHGRILSSCTLRRRFPWGSKVGTPMKIHCAALLLITGVSSILNTFCCKTMTHKLPSSSNKLLSPCTLTAAAIEN